MRKALIFKRPGKDDMVLYGIITIEEIKRYQAISWILAGETDYNKHGIPVVTKAQYLRWAE